MAERQPLIGERSKRLSDFKKSAGLPVLKDIQVLEEQGLSEAVSRKIEQYERYVAAQRVLYTTLSSLGWNVAKVVERALELEGMMISRKEKLEEEGTDPLEDDVYMAARDQLMKELQFIHKHGLDVEKFKSELVSKGRSDDVIFEVHNDQASGDDGGGKADTPSGTMEGDGSSE